MFSYAHPLYWIQDFQKRKQEHNFRLEVDADDFYEPSRFSFLKLIECATKAMILPQKKCLGYISNSWIQPKTLETDTL